MTTTLQRNPTPSVDRAPAVLIVDDDDDVRETLRACLEEEGFTVRTARNGLEALASLAEGAPPGLILLDLMMPEMNGWEVLERLRCDEAKSSIPVAVMSGSHRGEVRSANYVVPKPFDLGAMVELVRGHCGLAVRSSGTYVESRWHCPDSKRADALSL